MSLLISSPHTHSGKSVQNTMLLVMLALAPATIFGLCGDFIAFAITEKTPQQAGFARTTDPDQRQHVGFAVFQQVLEFGFGFTRNPMVVVLCGVAGNRHGANLFDGEGCLFNSGYGQ